MESLVSAFYLFYEDGCTFPELCQVNAEHYSEHKFEVLCDASS